MWKKIVAYTYVFIVFVLVVFSAVQTYRLGKNRRELEQVRNELQLARNRTADIRKTVKRFNQRTREIFSESISTVSDLRKQIHEVREQYEIMENYIDSIDSDFSDINNNSNNINKE